MWAGPVVNILVDVLTIDAWFGVVLGTLTDVMIDTLTDVMVVVVGIDMLNGVEILVWAFAVTTLEFIETVSYVVDMMTDVVVDALTGVIFRLVPDMNVDILATVITALDFPIPVS